MADVPTLLLASLQPDTRKQAEQNLAALSAQPGFLPALLQLVLRPDQNPSVRLAGSVYLKNSAKRHWEEVILHFNAVQIPSDTSGRMSLW